MVKCPFRPCPFLVPWSPSFGRRAPDLRSTSRGDLCVCNRAAATLRLGYGGRTRRRRHSRPAAAGRARTLRRASPAAQTARVPAGSRKGWGARVGGLAASMDPGVGDGLGARGGGGLPACEESRAAVPAPTGAAREQGRSACSNSIYRRRERKDQS